VSDGAGRCVTVSKQGVDHKKLTKTIVMHLLMVCKTLKNIIKLAADVILLPVFTFCTLKNVNISSSVPTFVE
jgi:hypothetical protein